MPPPMPTRLLRKPASNPTHNNPSKYGKLIWHILF
jgi:hypothetical protein